MTGTITTVIKKSAGRVRGDGTPDKGGYGFIRDEDGKDRFFHARDMVDDSGKMATILFERLQENDRVEFEPTAGNVSRAGGGNGLRAEKVRVAR